MRDIVPYGLSVGVHSFKASNNIIAVCELYYFRLSEMKWNECIISGFDTRENWLFMPPDLMIGGMLFFTTSFVSLF